MNTLRQESKKDWTSAGNLEHINAGSLQRIADATEKMARNFTSLQEDLDLYKRWYEQEKARVKVRDNQIRGLKGALTKANRKVSA